MAREEDDDDSLPPIGEDTVPYLEDAKKGKSRCFLLICKGTKVKYLKVKKKAIKKGEIAEAKKLGYKGDPYIGVLSGKGMDLVFHLAISDGYESEPVKDKILKDFLEEHAQFKCKPSFAIVATPPEIPFDDEDLSHPLIARFLALGAKVSQVLDTRPEAEGEIQQSISAIRVLLQEGSFQVAEPKINDFEIRLNALANGAPAQASSDSSSALPTAEPSASPPASPPSPPVVDSSNANDALKQKLEEALGKLVLQLKDAVAKFPEKKVELLSPVAAIKKQLESDDLQNAKQGILEVGGRLKSLLIADGNQAGAQNPPSSVALEDELRGEYERKRAALQPSYDQALQEMLGDTNRFRAVMSMAIEQADAGTEEGLKKAIAILDRLATAIEQAIASGVKETSVIPENVVADRKKFLLSRWQEAIRAAYSEIDKIVAPITSQVPEEDAQELVASIAEHLDGFVDDLDRAIMGAQTASSSNTKPIEEALKAIRDYRARIVSDPLLQQLDEAGSELGVEVKVSERLLTAIDELEQSLAG